MVSPAELDDTNTVAPPRDRRVTRSVSQRASTLRRLGVVWLTVIGGLAIASTQDRVPVEDLFLDASVVGGGRWYAGLVTSFAVMGWTVTAVSLGFASLACRRSNRINAAKATGWISLIATVLLFDDLFLLHTAVVPAVIGGSKWWLIAAEGVATAVWLVRWNVEIVRTRWELLVAAGVGFAGSLILDRYPVGGDQWSLVAEDGAKLLGVVALATWAVSTAADLIGSMVERRP